MRRTWHWFALACALSSLAVWGCFGLTRHLIVALDRIGDAGGGLAQTAARVNGRHGTIAMLDEDAGAARSLIIHADLVARHEQQQLSVWDDRGERLFANANGAITDLRSTIAAGGDTARAATGALQQTTATIADGRAAAAEMLPDLSASVRNLAETSKQAAAIGANLNATTADVQQALHPILNPEPCRTRGCKIGRALGQAKSAGSLSEAAYYTIETLRILLGR